MMLVFLVPTVGAARVSTCPGVSEDSLERQHNRTSSPSEEHLSEEHLSLRSNKDINSSGASRDSPNTSASGISECERVAPHV